MARFCAQYDEEPTKEDRDFIVEDDDEEMENELHYRSVHWEDPYNDYPHQFPPDPLKFNGMPYTFCHECGERTMIAVPGGGLDPQHLFLDS